jgi:hypothetical protein
VSLIQELFHTALAVFSAVLALLSGAVAAACYVRAMATAGAHVFVQVAQGGTV